MLQLLEPGKCEEKASQFATKKINRFDAAGVVTRSGHAELEPAPMDRTVEPKTSMYWRCYFNFYASHPWIWSIDSGTEEDETLVRGIQFHGISGKTGKSFHVQPGDTEQPRVWIEIHNAVLQMRCGIAHFYGVNG
ncbi:MAG: hypothetical protein KGL39_35615 [Patescibacteria group bacterium]|nr:hypothetical protein [Patescibacteria group bacterium]